MSILTSYQNNNDYSELFTKCFISLENLSDNIFQKFQCTVWNQPRRGMLNAHDCWRFDFYTDTPFKAMEKGFEFVARNKESDFVMNYDECLKLRNSINEI